MLRSIFRSDSGSQHPLGVGSSLELKEIDWENESFLELSSKESFQVVSESLKVLQIFGKFGYVYKNSIYFYSDTSVIKEQRNEYAIRAYKKKGYSDYKYRMIYRPSANFLITEKGNYENIKIEDLDAKLQELQNAGEI